jgi:hypothetical protein
MSDVTFRTRLWSQEVAMARAADELDAPGAGAAGLAKLLDRKEPGYEFSNGRRFADGTGAYE